MGGSASCEGDPPGAKDRGLVVRGAMTHPDSVRLRALGQAVADGKLVISILDKITLSEVREAQALAEHHAGGKVLLTDASAPLHSNERRRTVRYRTEDDHERACHSRGPR